ncbi:hypothetical protein [Photobacterium sp. J15]|uniref:hypothetical protein n=1 Tax=Photobacterium sp. J15 TaxID=265901 RepID=UPI0007E34381|nr:hypothetical protein [Photobacterium sp. J15]
MQRVLLPFICLLLVSCASQPVNTFSYPAKLETCLNRLTNFKQQVQQQGVQDAQLHWNTQYPHLSFDRFSIAMLTQIQSTEDKSRWLDYVSGQAAIQRKVEYQNLPDKSNIDFEIQEKCAEQLATHNKNNALFWLQIKQSPPKIPSGYQSWQRVVGLYPISKLFAAPAIESEKTRIALDFINPVHDYSISYRNTDIPTLNASTIHSWFRQALDKSDAEWPLLGKSQLAELQKYYAPEFIIETASNDDKPGQVAFLADGKPGVNISQPTLYLDHSYTRFHGRTLLQLHYSLWFPNRTAKSKFDPYAGKFDAVLVRLTLDHQGQPLILDSIHHCGCYHMVFALNPSLKFVPKQADTESPVTWYVYRNKTTNSLRITLSHGEHMIKDVNWGDNNPQARSLTLQSYDQLRSLPQNGSSYKSLFDQHGMLPDSRRSERFYLWPFGVKSPGAMRQYGQHATAFIGERHFDEPYVLERLFLPPSVNPR